MSDEYNKLTAEVITAAREFAKQSKAFNRRTDRNTPLVEKRELLHAVNAAEDELCARVEALEAWIKQHGFDEESEGKEK